jgi:paired small multidrug resistance pump
MMSIEMAWYDWVGIVGTLLILGGFFLLQAGRMSGNGLSYQLMNLLGAAGILVSLIGKFNVAVFLLELAWMLVSAYGIARGLRMRRQQQP